MRIALLGVAGLALVAACGPGAATLDPASLGLPQSASPATLASTTIATSPDGGIYKNPDRLDVLLAQRHSVAAVQAQLGNAASSWAALHDLGDFTLVGLRLRDDGKVGSDPQLNGLQMASDYAPAGTQTGALRHFYHPTYPLAVLASTPPGDGCSVHLDPGHTVIAVLVYPPVDLPRQMVWGSFGDFVLTVPTGGSLPAAAASLHATTCTPPVTQAPPT